FALALDVALHLKLTEKRFEATLHSEPPFDPLGPSELLSVGITPQQSDGLIWRIDWLVKAGRMPANREAFFYLHLNDARRALEHWYGKPKARSADDQTNYYE
ncbi:MAG: hypothetical protein C0469_16095, partial [Cyanobacteria bacterium DS2.3.42]|nr:hypothetical protein [Cyanobacteria bacterium DS2.3.42]